MAEADKLFSLFSSFPPAMIWEKRNRSLLIQFLAAELIVTFKDLKRNAPTQEILSIEKSFFPFDWAYPYGHINKMREYASVLESSFPQLKKATLHFQQLVNQLFAYPRPKTDKLAARCSECLPEIFLALEPFIKACKENENLIFFLLKHREEIDQCMRKNYLHALLLKLHPTGLSELCEKLCDNYHHRGFYFLIPEIKHLMSELR